MDGRLVDRSQSTGGGKRKRNWNKIYLRRKKKKQEWMDSGQQIKGISIFSISIKLLLLVVGMSKYPTRQRRRRSSSLSARSCRHRFLFSLLCETFVRNRNTFNHASGEKLTKWKMIFVVLRFPNVNFTLTLTNLTIAWVIDDISTLVSLVCAFVVVFFSLFSGSQ